MLSTSSLPTALYDHLAEIIRPYLGKIIFDFIWRKNVEEPPAKAVKAEEMSTDEAEGEEAIEVARAADGDEEFQRAVSPFVIVLNDSSDEMEEQPTFSGTLAVEIQGLFIKLQLVGSDQCVWMNMGSEDLQPLGYANKHEPFRYLPPKDVADAQDWNSPADMLPFLRDLEQKIVRDRVELLDTYGTDRLRVGTVKETRANRVLVELDMRYYLPNDDPNLTANDTQLPRTGTNWVEEDSPLLFHVGWANLSNYRLLVSNSLVRGRHYKHRARVVADAIQASQKNPDKPAVIKMMDGDARPGIVFSHCATEPKNRYPDADPSLFAKVPHDDQQIKTMFPIGSLVETNSIDDPEFFFPARVTGHRVV
ncbi:unnamed protein product, partial [Mesorhabditis spiculigera]